MSVDRRDDVPAVGLEALGCVVCEPTFDFAVYGYAIVIVKYDEFAEFVGSGEGACFVGNSFH